jgi:hypothetical protein
MAMNSTFTSLTRDFMVTMEFGSVDATAGEEAAMSMLGAAKEFCPYNGNVARKITERQEAQCVYFIPSPPKICTNSHGQRLPQLIRCKSVAEGTSGVTRPLA